MITIKETRDGDISELCLEGHAEYAEQGKDIVCAAVSTLVFTLAEALEDYDCLLEKDGDTVTVQCRLCDSYSEAAWQTITTGLLMTAENYPLNVEFK